MKNYTTDEMTSILKKIVDSKETTQFWPSMVPYLNENPDIFFGVLDIRYLGKKRLETLSTVMAFEQKGKKEDTIERLVYYHINKKIQQKHTKVQLYSIGYEAMDINKFIEKLKNNNINLLIDVREKALSRKKGFSKTSFQAALLEADIHYIHMKELGSSGEDRKILHENNNWREFSEKYLHNLEGKKCTLVEICNIASEKTSCLMCFERDYSKCHRSLIAKKIQQISGIEAVHI